MSQRQMNTERVQVAATLRRMREEAGLSREQAAGVLSCTASKIGDLETGRSGPKPLELAALLDRYGITGEEREELIEFARASQTRRSRGGHWVTIPVSHRRFSDLERQATSAIFYSGEIIHGTLQIEAYAWALLRRNILESPEVRERLLKLRLGRSAELSRTHRPPLRLWCILGEAALRSGVGGPAVMREQLEHLITMTTLHDNVVVQVLPLGSGVHDFMGLTVTLYDFPPPAPRMLHYDSVGRGVVQDGKDEVSEAAHMMDLLRAKALGHEESTEFIQDIIRELEES
ncbi:MAG: helix-turn-helix domain-containing protein [Pseudonocardiales bacterium]|nr:helix-turn-helix domain-containing protein [Pseudonocardiales bacterium]